MLTKQQSVADKSYFSKRSAQASPQPENAPLQQSHPAVILRRTATVPPSLLHAGDLLALQQSLGNRAVQRLLAAHTQPASQHQHALESAPVQLEETAQVAEPTPRDLVAPGQPATGQGAAAPAGSMTPPQTRIIRTVIQRAGPKKRRRGRVTDAKTASNNTLAAESDTQAQNGGNCGAYNSKIKWKLDSKAKKRGYIIQHVKFTMDIDDLTNGTKATFQQIDTYNGQGNLHTWNEYYELWKVSANAKAPRTTLNQDHFVFGGYKHDVPNHTSGWMKETGRAWFFETTKKETDLGFAKNADCPAGAYLYSSQNEPGDATSQPQTVEVDHKVKAEWNQGGARNGITTITEQAP